MHKLLDVSDFIFQEWTDTMQGKDIGNDYWAFIRSKFLDDSVRKIKVVDFVYDHILHLDDDFYKKKYDVNLSAIKKSKQQLLFVSEIVSKMIKFSGIPLIDY